MQTKQKPKVAIIGLGNLGKVVATNLIRGNREIILADANFDKAKELSNSLGEKAIPMNVSEAVKSGDILILAIYFSSIKEFLSEHKSILKGKILIDPSNPITPHDNGGFIKTIDENESSGTIISSLVPKDVKLVKAFSTLGVNSLETASHQNPPFVQFYANDDQSVDHKVEELIRDNGFEPLRIGDIVQSIRMEVFGDLNEFGTIGKPVCLEEAISRI
ncbi:MAG: NAD(P)-binding domain-containing protein [Flavobacterium sp.]|uniref:NADPH-dependent F420 reductase n=1 Tax=Flavobacterium sp. TaxID=239 RepID=UPI002FC8D8A5